MKDVIKIRIAVFGVMLVALLFQLPCWINDYSCSVYREEVESSLEEISEISVLQVVSGCGSSTGTGDHTDLYVAALVKTELGEDDIESVLTDITDIYNVSEGEKITMSMVLMNLRFDEENYSGEGNLYILEFSKRTPFSWLDLRGA